MPLQPPDKMNSNLRGLPRRSVRTDLVASRTIAGAAIIVATAAVVLAATSLAAAGAEPLTIESADTPAVLVELFTSEGCSSCPPADAWLSRLKSSPELWKSYVPVAYHVDYWNRLGWTDRFSSPEFTARQHRYAAVWQGNSVYTPEVAVNGREWRGLFDGQPLPTPAGGVVGKLKVTLRDRTRAEIVFSSSGPGPKPSRVEVALLGMNLESDVKRGENGGRKLRHDFVVLELVTAKLSADGNRYTASVPLADVTTAEPTALAAWVTTGDARPPIQAAGGWIKIP